MSIRKNFLSNSIVEASSLLIPLVSLPIIARQGSDTDVGRVLLFLLLQQIISQLVDFSFSFAAARKNADEYFLGKFYSARLILAGLVGLIFTSCSIFFYLSDSILVELIVIIALCGASFHSMSWYYFYTNKIYKYSLINFSQKLFFMCALFFLEQLGVDGIILCGSATFWIISFIAYRKNFVGNVRFNFSDGIYAIKSNLKLFLIDFMPQVYISAPLFFLSSVMKPALYADMMLAIRVYNAALIPQWSALKVGINAISNKKIKFTNFAYVLIALSIIQIIATMTVGDWVIKFVLGDSRSGAFFFLLWLSPSFLLASLYISFGNAYHISNRKESTYFSVVRNVTIIMVFIMPLFVSFDTDNGYIWGVLFSRLMLAIGAIFLYLRLRNDTAHS